jgi:RNA polymerase sigma factor (sigma-70 family)
MAKPKKVSKPKQPPREPQDSARRRDAAPDSLNAYIRDIAKFKPLSAEKEKELGHKIRAGGSEAQEALRELVEANLRFVVHYAKRYRGLGLSFMDLIHEGTLGLMEAAKRFDPERNVKFISYAVWWVRQAIFHALSEHVRVFRLPQKLSGQVSRLSAAREKLKGELERMPTIASWRSAPRCRRPRSSSCCSPRATTFRSRPPSATTAGWSWARRWSRTASPRPRWR